MRTTLRLQAVSMIRLPTSAVLALLAASVATEADDGPKLKGAAYLYAQPGTHAERKGGLRVEFTTPGKRLVIAYGRKTRKMKVSRDGTSEEEREELKPIRGTLEVGGKVAVFAHLPPDYYDVVVIDDQTMCLYEGIELYPASKPELSETKFFDEVKGSLGLRTDRIGGWEGFFDKKQFERLETDGVRGGMLLQQMRLGTTLAESGAKLKGTVHSIDVVWLERALKEGVGWQVITRQQLYRNEIPAREFHKHCFVKELQGIRVGFRQRTIGPIDLGAPRD